MMILKQESHITLKQEIKKINCLSTAYDQTYVLSVVVKPARAQAILHLNAHGDVLFRKDYDCEIGSFAMLREKEVIVLDVKDAVIEIINLETHTTLRVAHNFMLDDADQMQLLTFSDTRYFCVVEEGADDDDRVKLTYYDYNTIFTDQTPLSTHEHTNEDISLHCLVKANEHSKVVWFSQDQSELIEFHSWDLKTAPTGAYNCISIRYSLSLEDEDDSVTISNLWQSSEDIYTLVCSRDHQRPQEGDNYQPTNNLLIVDARQGTIRQSNFLFYNEDTGKFLNDYMADTFNLGTYSVIHTRQQKAAETVPLYFISNANQKIVQVDRWTPSSHLNFFVSGSDSSNLIMAEYDNGDVKEIRVTVKRLSELKEVAIHFMLHMNEDFDDDLLQDALDLMGLIE